MRKLRALSTVGTLGLLVASTLVFGSAQAGSAATCQTGTAAPTNTFPGTVAVATNFESNSLSPFTPTVSGTGTATISSDSSKSTSCSAKLHVTDDTGSLANLASPALPSTTKTAYADGWFNIAVAGVAGNNVPYFRFFSGSTRIADVYRNNNNGQLWLRVTSPTGVYVYTKLVSGNISLNAWHHVSMRVSTRGNSSVVQVWFDGAQKYSSYSVKMAGTNITKVQLGAEHVRQKGDQYIDDVIIKHRTS